MTALGERLAARIARHGPMTVADYMAEVLAHPHQGYYATRDPLGAAGDFVTAPEISQMFGELIGLWCAETWQHIGAPAPVLLVELGPGRGTLMADALRAAATLAAFRRALRLHLVEISPALRARQRAVLGDVEAVWHDSLSAVPQGPVLVVANEFFDALPVRQFERSERGWCERLVTAEPGSGRLAFALGPPRPAAAALIPPQLRTAPVGAIVEVSPAAIGLAAEIGRRLASDGGAAIVVDYGYGEPRAEATLQAVRRHRPTNPLAEPGDADLTAHVDFATLARAAREAGAEAYGPLAQGDFLERLGIRARAEALRAGATARQARDIDTALARLAAPGQMGELFKALALAQPGLGPPAGFAEAGA